jgi:hypothetical protein
MPTARALLVGLTSVNCTYYGSPMTQGITNSATNVGRMQGILTGFSCTTLIGTTDTGANRILDELQAAATALQPGDIFVFYFAGHGLDGSEAEPPGTLAAYDQPILVSSLKAHLKAFRPGVRIVMICDSCYASDIPFRVQIKLRLHKLSSALASWIRPPAVQGAPAPAPANNYNAQLIILAAAASIVVGGQLTDALVDVWNARTATLTYRQFYCAIAAALLGKQSPMYIVKGQVSDTFEDQVPFTVATPASGTRVVASGAYGSAEICPPPPSPATPSPPPSNLPAVPTHP